MERCTPTEYKTIANTDFGFPNDNNSYNLTTDASSTGTKAKIIQKPILGDRVMAYARRLLNTGVPSKLFSNKLRVNCCCSLHSLPSIFFTSNNFTAITTDPCALTWLCCFKETRWRLARWDGKFRRLQFEIHHKACENSADLSRVPVFEELSHAERKTQLKEQLMRKRSLESNKGAWTASAKLSRIKKTVYSFFGTKEATWFVHEKPHRTMARRWLQRTAKSR